MVNQIIDMASHILNMADHIVDMEYLSIEDLLVGTTYSLKITVLSGRTSKDHPTNNAKILSEKGSWSASTKGVIEDQLVYTAFRTSQPNNADTPGPANTTVEVVEGRDVYKSDDRWKVPVFVCGMVGALLVIAILLIKIHWRRRKLKHIVDAAEYRPYSLFSPTSGHGQELILNIPVVADYWEIPLSSLKFGPALGQGAFGKVVLGLVSRAMLAHRGLSEFIADGGNDRLKDGDKLQASVAIKMLQEGCDRKLRDDFLKEIQLMKHIGYHNNVIAMLACCTLREPLCLVVEHVTRGDLHNFMRSGRKQYAQAPLYVNENDDAIKPLDLVKFALDIAKGMTFLASKGYVHRDLAARNVLVTRDKTCKIGDFGLTRYIYDDLVYVNRRGGRLPIKWMSVEAIFEQSFSSASDVWSFGILLYELVTLGGVPYPTVHTRDLLRRLRDGYRMPRPETCHETTYTIMLECWRGEPDRRPKFPCLVERLAGMLDTGTDLVNGQVVGKDDQESDCSRNSTDTDDGLLLVSELCSDSPLRQDDPPVVGESNRIVPVTEIPKPHPIVLEPMAVPERNMHRSGPNLAQFEAGSEDSGFEHSPKVSDSGSEATETPLKQTNPVFFGDTYQENLLVTPSCLTSPPHITASGNYELATLDNEVIEYDGALEYLPKAIMKYGGVTSNHNKGYMGKLDRQWNGFVSMNVKRRSLSFGEIPYNSILSDRPVARRRKSDRSIDHREKVIPAQSPQPVHKKHISSTSSRGLPAPVQSFNNNLKTVRKERRKGVVTPPTLALDNETYLSLGRTFRQLPPPIQITRRSRAVTRSDDAASCCIIDTRRKSSSANSSMRKGQYDLSAPTLNGKSEITEITLYRVAAQIHQSQSSSSKQGSISKMDPKTKAKRSSITTASNTHLVQNMQMSSPGKLVERGNRKFIRPQDILIKNPDVAEECIKTLNADIAVSELNTSSTIGLTNPHVSENCRKMTYLNSAESSPSPCMPVSPVRYVHFRFPSVPTNSSPKRSLSENNILACATDAGEFTGFPRTMRNSKLLNETSPDVDPKGFPSWSDVSSSMKMTNQAMSTAGDGYIPVRRFSDPSSLPVSFIRRRSQASSPNSTSSTASRSSVVSPKLNVAQIYVRAESPSGMCDMHFRWPGAPLERNNISWDGCDIVDSSARDASFCGDIQQADDKKTFIKEKHPFALFQI